MRRLSKLRSVAGLAGAQLRHYRGRTALAVVGVAVAVVLVVLLVGLGNGVLTAGTSGLDWLSQDLWVSAGSLGMSPASVGGVDNPIENAHEKTERIEAVEGVESAQALAFQAVYASANRSSFTRVVGAGLTGNGVAVSDAEFSTADVHYANGSYDGPMTGEVFVDERTADMFNVSVGDTLYVGGTIAGAKEHEFEVVGVLSTFSTFLGTPTLTLHLSELQTLTGTAGTDPASVITVRTTPDADPAAVKRSIQEEFPEYQVRTNQEQLTAVVGDRAMVTGSAVTLVILAVVVGATLVANVLALLVYHQRREFAALKATGIRSSTLVGAVATQSFGIAVLGGLLGCIIAIVATPPLNALIAEVTGFAALIKLPWWVYIGGVGIAILMGFVGAAVAGRRVAKLSPDAQLQS